MAENTAKTQTEESTLQSIGSALTKGANWIDGMSDALVDTIAPENSQLDSLVSNYSNASMLSNLLTSNSPTLNVKQGLEELCEFIADFKSDPDFGKMVKKFFDKIYKLMRKVILQISQQLISALYDAVLKLRRMVISKLKAFLAEYVADACISGLQEHLADLMNPKNALSISEMASTIKDIVTDVGKNIDDALKAIRETVVSTYNFVTGSAYTQAKADYENELVNLKTQEAIEIDGIEDQLEGGLIDEAEAKAQIKETVKKAAEYEAAAAKKVAIASQTTVWSIPFWEEKTKKFFQLLYEMACARTASYIQNENFGLTGGIQADIKKYMQGCLFQQALKTAKNIDPNGLSADVLNRINNLAQNGSMLDAYNVALAAGIDLSSSQFQIELPSSNGWVSTIYGDPYMFSPETPLNAAKVAQYLTSDLPTTQELLDGKIDDEKASQPYVAENWNAMDSSAASVANKLAVEIQVNKDIIEGQESLGQSTEMTKKTIAVIGGTVTDVTDVSKTVIYTRTATRNELVEKYTVSNEEYNA